MNFSLGKNKMEATCRRNGSRKEENPTLEDRCINRMSKTILVALMNQLARNYSNEKIYFRHYLIFDI